MTDLTKPFFGNPRETAKADKARAKRAVPYETTWLDEVLRGMFGAETSGSVFDPDRADKVTANQIGQGVGIASDLATPGKALALGALPAFGGIIGGPLARSALTSPKNIKRAEEILKNQGTPGYVLQETGLAQTPLSGGGRAWGPQIYDGNVKIDQDVLKKLTPSYAQDKGPIIRLSDLLDHPELYEAYPHLKNIQVNAVNGWDQLAGVQGSYNSRTNKVQLTRLNEYMPERTLPSQLQERTGTLLHELQHGVQDFEKLPRGGNTGEFAIPSTSKAEAVLRKKQNEFRDVLTGIQGGPLVTTPESLVRNAQRMREGKDVYWLPPPTLAQVARLANDEKLFQEALSSQARFKQLEDKIKVRTNREYSQYRSLAGEAQARAVQNAYLEKASPRMPQTAFYDQDYTDLLFRPPQLFTIKP